MARISLYILIIICTVTFCGCFQPAKPEATEDILLLEGLTVQDIQPIDPVDLPHRILFRAFVFEVPSDRVREFNKVFDKLNRERIRFVDSAAFEANGFVAGLGRAESWQDVALMVDKVKAKSKEIKRLMIYGDSENDIAVALLNNTQRVSFVGTDQKEIDRKFVPGTFSWTIRARPTPSMPGVAQVEIRPLYRIGGDNYISRLAQFRNVMPLDAAAFGLKMSSGDFILMAPAKPCDNKVTLKNLLFSSPLDDSMSRVYMVGCVRVGD